MQRNIFIHADEKRAGKSLISFTILKLFQAIYPRIAFYRPITENNNLDQHIDFACNYLQLDLLAQEMSGPKLAEVELLLQQNKTKQIIKKIDTTYQKLRKNHDIIVCDVAILPTNILKINSNINLEIANNLNCEIITIISAMDKTIAEIANSVLANCHALKHNGCQVIGIIINRALPTQIPAIKDKLAELKLDYEILGIIPEDSDLAKPSVLDIKQILDAKIIAGANQTNRIVSNHVIAAKQTSNFLKMNHSKNDSLIITPGDRHDILLSAILGDQSKLYPKVSGIVLTAGIKPTPIIQQIIEGIDNIPTVMLSNLSTFEVAAKLYNTHYSCLLSNKERLDKGCKHIADHLETKHITSAKLSNNNQLLNRHMLLNYLLNAAKSEKKHLVFPEGDDLRVLTAAHMLLMHNAANVTVIGESELITEMAIEHGLDLSELKIIEPNTAIKRKEYALHLYEKRKHKNMTINIAEDMITDRIMFATIMVDLGDADAMVSGAVHTTSDTVRPALQIIKAKPKTPFVCSIFVMCMAQKVVIYGDCALTINPNSEQLAHIAKSAAAMAKLLNIEPKVALLSYSSGISGHGTSVEKVREASKLLSAAEPNLAIAGPIQYDAAVDPNIGKRKLPNNPVAGQANVLIFPDLDTGNNTYKAVQREANGLAIGPILLGLNKPINDLSRGCDADEIFMTALITLMQAKAN